MFERKFGGDFPRAAQPGKLHIAGLEIILASPQGSRRPQAP